MEVPKTSSLSNPQYAFNGLNVSKSDLFRQVKVEHAFEDLYDCSYLQMVYDMNNGQDVSVYGWIDSVSCSSDTPGKPVTVIDWHVDLWRTYLSKAVFGAGYVTRRPSTSDIPSQPYSPRYQVMNLSGTELIKESSNIYWCFVQCTVTVEGTSTQQTLCFPVDVMNGSTSLDVGNSEASYSVPSFNSLITGGWDELLGLDPEAVYGVFLSPYSPNNVTSTGVYSVEGWYPVGLHTASDGGTYGALQKSSVRNAYGQFYKNISGFQTTDTSTVVDQRIRQRDSRSASLGARSDHSDLEDSRSRLFDVCGVPLRHLRLLCLMQRQRDGVHHTAQDVRLGDECQVLIRLFGADGAGREDHAAAEGACVLGGENIDYRQPDGLWNIEHGHGGSIGRTSRIGIGDRGDGGERSGIGV